MIEKRKSEWTIPNALTILRLLLVPVFVFYISKNRTLAALVVFAAASLTDCLDGWIARRFNQITDFGKLMDPLADKLMVLTVLISQAVRGVVPWPVIIIVAVKEAATVAGGTLLYRRGTVVHSLMIGKIAQVCFSLALMLTFFHDSFAALPFYPDQVLLWVAVGLCLAALGFYIVKATKGYFEKQA